METFDVVFHHVSSFNIALTYNYMSLTLFKLIWLYPHIYFILVWIST